MQEDCFAINTLKTKYIVFRKGVRLRSYENQSTREYWKSDSHDNPEDWIDSKMLKVQRKHGKWSVKGYEKDNGQCSVNFVSFTH